MHFCHFRDTYTFLTENYERFIRFALFSVHVENLVDTSRESYLLLRRYRRKIFVYMLPVDTRRNFQMFLFTLE